MCASRATNLGTGLPNVQIYMEGLHPEGRVTNNKDFHHHRRHHRRRYFKKGGADIGPTEPPRYGVNYTNVT